MRKLIEASVRQRAVGNVAFVLIALIGVVTYLKLPVDAWPEVGLDEAWITTYWDGAGAEEVELLVTEKIEEEIESIRGVDRIISISSPNMSFIDVKFDEDLGPEKFEVAFNDLRTALNRVADLPPDAEVPVLQKLTTSEVYPIFQVAVYAEDPGISEIVLREVARDLERELEAVEGVNRIMLQGARDRELTVEVDRLLARRYGVDLTEIFAALGRAGRAIPAGTTASGDGSDGEADEVRLKHDGEFDSSWEILDAIVRTSAGGEPIRVRDLATIRQGFEKQTMISRFNGRPAVMLNISKDLESNSIELRQACQDVMDRVAGRVPRGVAFGVTADSTQVVESRFTVLLENLALGLILVTVILSGLLGIRNALIAIVGIPFSFLLAIICFPILDISINNLTLFGMVLVGGMLVDDAVVVLENIYRRIEEGLPTRQAVIEGTHEVAWPVINAVATTSAAMLPLLIQGGVTGKFFSYIPKAVLLALGASLVQCFTILPIHYFEWGARLRKNPDGSRKTSALGGLRDRAFGRLTETYRRALSVCLGHRYAFIVVLLGGSISLIGLVSRIPQDPWTSDFNAILFTMDCDPSYSLEQTDRAMAEMEKVLDGFVERQVLEDYSTTVGFKISSDGVFIRQPNVALVLGELVDSVEITSDPERPLNDIRQALEEAASRLREHRIDKITVFPPHDGPPLGRPVAVRVESPDYDQARQVAQIVQDELRAMEGVFGIQDNRDLGPVEVDFALEDDRASRLGIFSADLGLALRLANDGLVTGSYREDDEDIDIRVRHADADRGRPEALLETQVRSPTGTLVPLEDLARLELGRSNSLYYHYDTRRTVLVTAEVDSREVTGPEVNLELQRRLEDIPVRYPGVRLHFGGEFEETRKSMEQQRQSFGIALVLIYIILVAQFRNYLQPLVVLATVPFGVLGVLLGLFLRDQPFTIPTFIAIIGLAGVVVNEALVMVVFINKRLRETDIHQAILIGASQRLRPILITSLTTVANLVPLAFGFGGVSKVWTPFAVSIVFGMSVSTVITLFLTPILYSFTARVKLRSIERESAS